MKGIKRDPSLFPNLKDEKFHDSWHRSFENQMHAQGLHQVIDPTYNPTTLDEQAVFGLMQTFTYAVLEAKVLTTKGKEIVRQFELTRDARGTYAALLKHHRSSTASTIAARDIMAFLTTSTVGDGRVKGTTSDFISYWCDQARLYQQLLGSNSSLSDDEKMIHLVRAVATIPELRSIKATADMLSMTTGVKVSFPQYYQLLVSAAAQYDSTSKTAPKRMVYQHDIHDEDDNVEFDLDTPVDTFYVHAAVNNGPNSTTTPRKFGLPSRKSSRPLSWVKPRTLLPLVDTPTSINFNLNRNPILSSWTTPIPKRLLPRRSRLTKRNSNPLLPSTLLMIFAVFFLRRKGLSVKSTLLPLHIRSQLPRFTPRLLSWTGEPTVE